MTTRPLISKLAMKPDARYALVGAPPGFEAALRPLPNGAAPVAEDGTLDFVLLFAPDEAALRSQLPEWTGRLADDGMLWVAWPKKASGVPSDLSFDRVQSIGLEAGLVDNKICSVDEVWSGLRFVYRLKDRRA